MSSLTTVVYDDSDTDHIKYINALTGPSQGKGWSPYVGLSLNEDLEGAIHNSTLHVATITGASLEFTFSGTRIAVFGSVWPPTTTYVPLTISEYAVRAVDSAAANVSSGSFQAPNLTIPKNNLEFFTSDDMPYGTYVLTVNLTGTSIDWPYYLDYFAIQAPRDAKPLLSTTTSQSSAASSTPTSALQGTSSPPSRLGPVMGAVAGIILTVAVVIVAVIFVRRGRRYTHVAYDDEDAGQRDTPSPPPPTPFVLPYYYSSDGMTEVDRLKPVPEAPQGMQTGPPPGHGGTLRASHGATRPVDAPPAYSQS
ncbi:hypothetical protein BD413DRAFT_623345 [Trametes elegans]|nr:hypothetical protein BD413DRAFT_623345 [Trametes elegans]